MTQKAIVWFRQDLRLSDNPALCAAAKYGSLLPIYIWDDVNPGDRLPGAASRAWLHHSLQALNEALEGNLACYRGNPLTLIPQLCKSLGVQALFWNRCYAPWQIARDTALKAYCKDQAIETHSFNGGLLWEPWEIKKKDGAPYQVFTPFYRKGCLAATPPRKPMQKPRKMVFLQVPKGALTVKALKLLPENEGGWDQAMLSHWTVGEAAARDRLSDFLQSGLTHYKQGRNVPALEAVSRLSPHLQLGEISPHTVWHRALTLPESDNLDCFLSELGWREFSYSLMYFNPTLAVAPLQKKFSNFGWRTDKRALKAWQRGQTGIPIVDAGMRQLWETGYMHNRVRMIVGSFLVKNLLLDWRHGERWFWDCLVDADEASNTASWQWVSGCGADAAPYFRVFNPVLQGQKFDAQGHYTRRWVPELAQMPDKYLFNPWEAPAAVLTDAKVTLGKTYPKPIVDLKASRLRALDAFQKVKQ